MTTPRQLALSDLAQRCAQETERYFRRKRHDQRFCYELFRRAIVERDDACWDMLYQRYRPLVLHWIRRHPQFPACGEEDEFFANRAFEKLWSALTPEKFDRKANLQSILAYLHMCTSSAVIDHLRSLGRARMVPLEDAPSDAGSDDTFEVRMMFQIRTQELWRSLESRMQNDRERKVAYASFVLDLKPREILGLHPGVFDGVDDVYSTKQNLMARLRRDREFEALLQADA